ncbi:protein KINESIN LIGHT CHAIN-RELATED 2 [Senna tora]|uniref:Protein KINESIN LIGHT CHAIN-RELATED 2 n=1 Tax=Senna tora TaxID=362788 RepID=A0A834WES1_9FABA|nr:protein KINESIN LIGHT CHAIN-RELATED 2 [Senna tora]
MGGGVRWVPSPRLLASLNVGVPFPLEMHTHGAKEMESIDSARYFFFSRGNLDEMASILLDFAAHLASRRLAFLFTTSSQVRSPSFVRASLLRRPAVELSVGELLSIVVLYERPNSALHRYLLFLGFVLVSAIKVSGFLKGALSYNFEFVKALGMKVVKKVDRLDYKLVDNEDFLKELKQMGKLFGFAHFMVGLIGFSCQCHGGFALVDDAIEILVYVVGMKEEKLGTANPDVEDEKPRLAHELKEAGRARNNKSRRSLKPSLMLTFILEKIMALSFYIIKALHVYTLLSSIDLDLFLLY